MEAAMKRRRRLLIALLVLVLLVAAVYWGGRRFLASQRMAREVAGRLASWYGVPVKLGEVDIGLHGTSLRQLELYEPTDKRSSDEPWLRAEEVLTDVSPWDLLHGDTTPHELSLDGAAVTLRFNKDGRLLTGLPKTGSTTTQLPGVHINQGRLSVHQEGRPPMQVNAIDVTLQAEGDRLLVNGRAADSFWGDWQISGEIDVKKESGSATLKTDRADVTQAKLEALPFVSPKVWKEVQIEGQTPLEATFRFDANQKDSFHYHVGFDPPAANVFVTALNLKADHVHGQVLIDDGRVKLSDVEGNAAKGRVTKLNANLDFESTPERLDIHAQLTDLDMTQLPESGPLFERLHQVSPSGLVSGTANVKLTLEKEDIVAGFDANGNITHARLGGEELTAKPIRFQFQAQDAHFPYSSLKSNARNGQRNHLAALAVLTLAPQQRAEQGSPTDVLRLPTLALDELQAGIRGVTRALTTTSQRVLALVHPAPRPPGAPPHNYASLNLGLEDVDLAKLIQGFNLKLPVPVSGRLTFDVQASIPIDAPRALEAYRFKGTATLAYLNVAHLHLEQVRARVTLDNGVLRLEELSGRVANGGAVPGGPSDAGSFAGRAQMELAPRGDFGAHLKLDLIPLDRVASLFPEIQADVRGSVNANLDVQGPMAHLEEMEAWKAKGNIQADRVEVYGLLLQGMTASLDLDNGIMRLVEARVSVQGTPVTGTGDLKTTSPYPYHAKVTLPPFDLASLNKLAPDFRPPVSLAGRFQGQANAEGTLNPPRLQLSGKGVVTDLKAEGVTIGHVDFDWSTDGSRLNLTEVKAQLYGGQVTGSGVVPLRSTEKGSLKFSFQDLDVGELAKALPRTPIRLEGHATGSVEGDLTPANLDRQFNGKLTLKAPELRVQGIPTERLTGTIDYRKGTLEYRFEGETLGGRFHINGKLPTSKGEPPPGGGPEGEFQLQGAHLSQLGPALHSSALRPLRGDLDLDLRFGHGASTRGVQGAGRVRLRSLAWDDEALADHLEGTLSLNQDQVLFPDVTGTFAGGLLRARASYNIRQPDRSWFVLNLDRVDASQVLAPWPNLARELTGTLDARLRGTFGREWTGGGDIVLSRGKLGGLDVSDWRLPLQFAFAPSLGNAELRTDDTSGQLAQGRVSGRASLRLGLSNRLDGHLTFSDLNVAALLRELASSSQVGSGLLTGRVDFSGHEVHSLNEVSAVLTANLRQTQALQMPVLQHAAPFVAPGQSQSILFNQGDLKARLANGILRIDRLSLTGSIVKLFVEGTVSLQGRLNLDVTASTGGVGPNPTVLRLIGLRLPAVGPIPLVLITQASNYLSFHTIHLSVLGTIRSPIVRVQPVQLLTEEAVRYFLTQAVMPAR
jgi:hypothetical protein